MSRWSQFLALAMAQLTGRTSLRDVVSNLAAQSRKLYHLGCGPVTRSSLAHVNEQQPAELCEAVFGKLLERWKIELFFRWIKQHLKIKSFLGRSHNAVLTQFWIAMIAYLLLAYLKFQLRLRWSLSHILRLLQLNLFDRRDLAAMLQKPASPPHPPPLQSNLVFS